MGVFGVKIYEDDLALDVKEEYLDKLKKGIKDEVALKEMVEEYEDSIDDIDDGPVFWIALADTMWKVGRLTEKVKKEALNAIDKNLTRWKNEVDEKEYKLRKKELLKFKDKINKEMPARKNLFVEKEKSKKEIEWHEGEIYAYKLESKEAKEKGLYGRYLVIRKLRENDYFNKRINAIAYCQITKNKDLPKSVDEINGLPYIIMFGVGNVRYEYKIDIYNITKKVFKEKFIYLGNYKNIKEPYKEYEPLNDNEFVDICNFKDLETTMLKNLEYFGSSDNPIYREGIDIRNMNDSKIRFLMRARYYEEKLNITPPEGAIVKDDPLLYIALVDSMMIGGIVLNPVGPLTDEMKQEAYKRIEILKNVIKERKDTSKEEKLKILDELKTKIETFDQKSIFPYNM